MANAPVYQIEQHKDFEDFYAYCDVFNYHFENNPHWANGVADVRLAHDMFGIFDAHTNKSYIIDGSRFDTHQEACLYAHRQVQRCRSKYPEDAFAIAAQQKAAMAQQRYLSFQRAMDY